MQLPDADVVIGIVESEAEIVDGCEQAL